MPQPSCAERALIAVSVFWLLALPLVAGTRTAFVATAVVITVNAMCCLHSLTQTRRVLVALGTVQMALFGALSFQLASAFGDEHFHFDREPWFFDWIEFTIAHVLRAADVLDALEEYGLRLQTITHRSVAAGVILVCMHLTVDAFLLDLAMRWLGRFWQETHRETRLERGRREFSWLLLTLALFGLFGILLQLRPIDWLLWPLDQLLRLLDVGDVMNVFGWRLHSVELSGWTSSAALVLRLTAGIWMARLVILMRMTLLRTWGVSVEELTKLLDDEDAQVRRAACVGLGQSGPEAASAVPALVEALHDIDAAVRLDAMRTLGRIGPPACEAAPRLVEALWLSDGQARHAAAAALGQIGPDARQAVHALLFLMKVCDDDTCKVVLLALKQIAPEILATLPFDRDATPPDEVPPSKRRAAWQRCIAACRVRESGQATMRVALLALLEDGYFAEARDLGSLQAALGALSGALTIPLLELTAEGKLSRTRNSRGEWIYQAADAVRCAAT